jgi:MFS family permease
VCAGRDPIKEHLWLCTDPTDAGCAAVWGQLDPSKEFCAMDPSAWEWTRPYESVRSDFGLICDRAWLMDLTNSIFFLGFLFGAFFWGSASDHYGRYRTLIATCASSAAIGFINALTYTYGVFIVARFFSGIPSCPSMAWCFRCKCELT